MTKKINGLKRMFLELTIGAVLMSMFLVLAPIAADLTAMPEAQAATWWDKAYNGGLNNVGQAYGQTSSPSADTYDIRLMIARIIRRVLELLGLIFLILIIVAGFKWMTASGDEEKVTGAKKLLTNSVIGLVIILSAFALATYIFNQLQYTLTGVQPIGWSW